MVISWFSCGVTSAVATKLALSLYNDVRIYYIDTSSEHPDSMRFLHDCEYWFGRSVNILHSNKFRDKWDVLVKSRYLNGSTGARCSLELKKKVRYRLQDELGSWDGQVFGFDLSERLRAKRFAEQNPIAKPLFPLIEGDLTKANCMQILLDAGIEIPMMYRLGFPNNNCIGCVKGGKGYWALIRACFPAEFARMATFERAIGHSCINGCFLDHLPSEAIKLKPIIPSCGLFCDVDFLK